MRFSFYFFLLMFGLSALATAAYCANGISVPVSERQNQPTPAPINVLEVAPTIQLQDNQAAQVFKPINAKPKPNFAKKLTFAKSQSKHISTAKQQKPSISKLGVFLIIALAALFLAGIIAAIAVATGFWPLVYGAFGLLVLLLVAVIYILVAAGKKKDTFWD